MKIYVATLSPPEEFRGFYSSAAAEIQKLGHQPFDPYGPDGARLPWPCLLETLIGPQCQGLYLLKGWQNSVEATVERHICLRTGKVILFQSAEERKKSLDQEKLAIAGRIQEALHEVTGLTPLQYNVRCRQDDLVFARMVFAYHGRRMGLSPDEISKELNISKSMVYHYLKIYPDEVKYNPKFRDMAEGVDKILN